MLKKRLFWSMHRPSQIAYTVTTMHITGAQTTLHVHENFCTVLICFYRSRFCSLAINQISFSQSKGWFPFILLCRCKKYHWIGLLGLHIYYTNTISELYQHMYSYINRFFTVELKQVLRIVLSMCYFCESHEL